MLHRTKPQLRMDGADRAIPAALAAAAYTYAARRTAEGKTTREIRRCIKRYLARSIYRMMEHPTFDTT